MPLAVGPPQRPARHEYSLALHSEVSDRHLCLLLTFRCRRVAEGVPQLVHAVDRCELGPGLLRLVEEQVCPEAARERELSEAAPDRELLEVLEAVVRWLLVVVCVHHEHQ